MIIRLEEVLASLPAEEQASIQAQAEQLLREYDLKVEALARQADRQSAHAAARAVIEARRTRDADLPACASFG